MAGYDLSRLNMLIVDDNKHMVALLKTIMHALGIRGIRGVYDAAEAFETLRNFDADIIFCDWAMSPLDGLDFTRLVRTARDSPNPYIPIIMLTGYTDRRRVEEARDVGVTEFLAKPVSASSVFSRLRKVIEQPRPFVDVPTYFGPDRRRHQNPNYKGKERRINHDPMASMRPVVSLDVS
jgi:PleD family two-component response regulator